MILEFNDRQMQAMLNDDEDFIDYFTTVIMPKHLAPFAILSESVQTREMIRWGRRYAEHFGFDDPVYQVHFVVLMWKIGANFFEFPPYQQIIADEARSQEDKMKLCNLAPTFEEEDLAIRKSDESYWSPQYIMNNILGVPYDDIEEQYFAEKDR